MLTRKEKMAASKNNVTNTSNKSLDGNCFEKLSEDNKIFFTMIQKYIDSKFDQQASLINDNLSVKLNECENKIQKHEDDLNTLTNEVNLLKNENDNLLQYSMKDNIILSGACIPSKVGSEDLLQIVTGLVNQRLQINLKPSDIS